jgi:hypothetical protein
MGIAVFKKDLLFVNFLDLRIAFITVVVLKKLIKPLAGVIYKSVEFIPSATADFHIQILLFYLQANFGKSCLYPYFRRWQKIHHFPIY